MTEHTESAILRDVAQYYTETLRQHGETPRGVDWNGEDSHLLRFAQLTKVITPALEISVNDVGCGYGALYDVLKPAHPGIRYTGCDVSAAMIESARARYAHEPNVSFVVTSEPDVADYGIASGILNVRMNYTDDAWHEYFRSTLALLNRTSTKGFAFNCLTSYSDREKQRDYLYYANPGEWFDYCKRNFSRNVAILHDYGLYEFTILVRKNV